ncbi:GrdB-related putative oxidoreductase [Lactiplantibacillus xiangfangensis]|uniref:Glycine sarcosine betaine reductase selenoprotein B n=1 Tax=Lactiplantibacillus xiangfangensis TaxID=942150 RepID=A0A0R2M2Q9_9LACO|nr:GrdB-related putative oxidoreductase [Lactiplantibacillus xiangfangensis]KRO07798.1 glycine sarcosine betaine reductase selenoprotein B [Lactiplantibacillus xiangfangensis]
MKVIVLLDQIQAGLGGKEKADTELGGKKLAMGAADTLAKDLKQQKGDVMATFYCGTGYYADNRELVQGKVMRMCKKMAPDVLLVGPTYDYPEFAQMACEVGLAVQSGSDVPVVAMVAREKNADLLAEYQRQLDIVKMPKKGGTGLSDAIEHGLTLCAKKANKEDATDYISKYCY